MANQIPAHFSLVKYSTPVLISIAKNKQTETSKYKKEGKQLPPVDVKGSMVGGQGGGQKDNAMRTEDILNQIIPPKEYNLPNGQLWVQNVLSTPATRTEVSTLKEELDKRLEQKQARETGICPIREELFEQCFDELIRQITIDCKERGLLLVQVRNEIRRQLDSYKTLYESSIAYGMRKMIESEQAKTKMQNEKMMLDKQCEELNTQVEHLDKKIESVRQAETEKLESLSIEHKEKVAQIKQVNQQIKDDLEKLLRK